MKERPEKHAFTKDPWALIAAIRADSRIPPEEQADFDALHARFEQIGTAFADDERVLDAMILAFAYGAMAGNYVAAGDPTLPNKVRALNASLAGRRSAEARQVRPWQKHATEMAIALREEHPKWSQEKLAETIAVQLPNVLRERKDRVGVDTLTDFISKLEHEGKLLPRR